MSNIIFYFTGTGNSLSVARGIAEKIGDTKVVSIPEAMKESEMDLSYERIGFVFPVYYSGIPSIVKQFITKLNFDTSKYVFGVVTYGGTQGTTLRQLNSCIGKQGGTLSAGFSVGMPGNYIVKYGAFPKIIQRMLFRREKKKVDRIAIALREKNTSFKSKGDLATGLFAESMEKIITALDKSAGNFHVNGKCTTCASCERICPVENIKMKNGQPSWGNACEQCMACIQWCPAQAIEYGDKTAKRKRYQHPEVSVSDLISNPVTKDAKLE